MTTLLIPAAILAAGIALAQIAPEPYSSLAQFDPPAWNASQSAPATTTGTRLPLPQPDIFRLARESYARHDYASCSGAVRSTLVNQPKLAEARYWLGICATLGGQTEEGINSLRQVAEQGDSPFRQQARFYLAKALLARNDSAGAKAELQRLIELQGELSSQAADLLAKIG